MKNYIVLFILLAAFLSGCASTIMQSYVGKDVREAMVDYGPPVNAFDMGDGRRAFQWVMSYSYTTPAYATTTGTATTMGYQTWLNSNTIIHGGQTINSRCVYTLFAIWNKIRNAWQVTSFQQPQLRCE